ncbi:hypothetical protein SDC9_127658 [bioreactor metagenome]|uniref:Uncharacterized protein n=1 Tax=bioreactor metagenome TaxID=1076179 RepID=A0A645CUS1_9ZZZZ
MVISRARHRNAKQVLIVVHRLNHRAEEEKELRVLIWRFAWLKQVDAGVCRNGPVVVFAAAVDALEWLFVQQADEAVLFRHALHDLHGQLVVVRGDIRCGKNRGELVLRRRNLVMLGLGQHAEVPEFLVELVHKGLHTGFDGAEIVIFEFLPLGSAGAEEGAAGEHKVGALVKIFLIDEEVFLLVANRGGNSLDVFVAKEPEDAHRLTIDGLHRAEQRGFFIQRFSAVGAKGGRNTENLFLYKRIACRIPRGIAARFKRCAEAAGGEAGRIRLALYELLAGEFHGDAAAGHGGDKAIVLLRRDSGERLEPMRKVRCALFNRPVFHGVGNHIGDGEVKPLSFANGGLHGLVGVLGQTRLHDSIIEHLTAE